ncbi:unnamed protein product [Adineta ricciae]|nr:unnamed protein product [Adineta ricciae]
MGGLFSRRKTQYDPNFYNDPYYPGAPTGLPGPYSYAPGPDPYGGLGGYEPDPYGYGYYGTDPFETYGGPYGRGSNYYGGRYGRGYNQMGGMSPWNYGNFYLGNTTMQMVPYMQRKLAKYAMRQGMGGFGGACMPMMPCMPMIPCMPSCAMPMASPMMAIAAPLPVAYNPCVQGRYPVVTANAANFMTPSSFMSALTTGPMPYRPPASFDLPNNIGMVMTVPYGAPNPLLATPTFGGFQPQFNGAGGFSCCCNYCTPCAQPLPPAITYYPRPVSVPQPCPVPCPVPVPIPNVQQVPVPRPVTVVAPPIVASCNQPLSIPAGAPLLPSQGGFTQNGFGQTLVMRSNDSTSETASVTSDQSKRETPVPKTDKDMRRKRAQEIAASLSNLGLNTSVRTETTSSRRKNRPHSKYTSCNFDSLNLSNAKDLYGSDWLTSDALADILNKSKYNRHKKSTVRHSRSHHHKSSLRSDHDCAARQQEQLDLLT